MSSERKRATPEGSTISEQPLKKRTIFSYTRREDSAGSPSTQWTPSDVVFLQVPSQPSPLLFEASRSLLARESPVFDGMFSLSQGDNSAEGMTDTTYEGRPVIPCYDDPMEMERFLEALHDPRRYFEDNSWTQCPSLRSLLRLGTKYQVSYMRLKVLDHMEKTSYYTSLNPARRAESTEDPHNLSTHGTMTGIMHCDLRTIQLLQEVDAPWLLPAAFLRCVDASISASKKLRQLAVQDESSSQASVEETYFHNHATRSACLDGIAELEQCSVTLMIEMLQHAHGTVSNDPAHLRGRCFRMISGYTKYTGRRIEYLSTFSLTAPRQFESDELRDRICEACHTEQTNLLTTTEAQVWRDLPKIFKVGESWEALLALRDANRTRVTEP